MRQRNSRGNQSFDVLVILLLLGLIVCLAGNVLGIELAIMQNDQVCQRAALAVLEQIRNGAETTALESAALNEIAECSPENFFISSPRLTTVTDEQKGGKHKVRVETEITAKVPAAALVYAHGANNILQFHRSYTLELPEPHESNNIELNAPKDSSTH